MHRLHVLQESLNIEKTSDWISLRRPPLLYPQPDMNICLDKRTTSSTFEFYPNVFFLHRESNCTYFVCVLGGVSEPNTMPQGLFKLKM